MKLTNQIKPISTLKAQAAEIIRNLEETRNPVIITQNGEAKAVLQDIQSYEDMQNTIAMLKMLAISEKAYREGKYKSPDEAYATIVESRRKRRNGE